MVKSYGPEKVMVTNGGLGMADCADGTMIESYVCSWAWKGWRQNWEQLKGVAENTPLTSVAEGLSLPSAISARRRRP
jgi:hypothetical protein